MRMTSTAAAIDAPRLFNCCTDLAEPDWSRFERLEIVGCRTEHTEYGDEGTICGQDINHAEFFTVFGWCPNNGYEPITDALTPGEIMRVAALLGVLSSLPVEIATSLACGEDE